MKVNYFGYYLQNLQTAKSVLIDLRPFLKAFTKLEAADFKNSFRHYDENLYLINVHSDTYLFLMTRNNELIRKIDTNDISVGDISSLLETDEHIGFASYIIIKEDFFGFGSTVLAPKADVFATYMNNLFESLGLIDWRFVPHALMVSKTKNEVLQLEHFGRTTIEVAKENSICEDILALFTANVDDTVELGSIEITFKPKPKQNIKAVISKVIDAVPDEGLNKMMIRAKGEGLSLMTDLYLVGSGAISDSLNRSQDSKIPHILETKITANNMLREKLMEYRSDEKFEKTTIDTVSRYFNDSSWTTFISNLQEVDGLESDSVN